MEGIGVSCFLHLSFNKSNEYIMSCFLKTICIVFFLMFCIIGNAQKVDSKVLNHLDLLNSQRANQGGGDIFIEQIGERNTVQTILSNSETFINLIQIGADNVLSVSDNSEDLKLTVLQNGTNNKISKYGLYALKEFSAVFIQNGENQNLDIFGSNELSKNMKVEMQGLGQSIVIRNFN